MADTTLVDPMMILPPNTDDNDDFDPLPIPPLDPSIFSDDFHLSDSNFLSFDDQDFDITFDDLYLPSDTDEFLNSGFNPAQLSSDPESGCVNEYISDPESGGGGDRDLNSESDRVTDDRDVAGFLNIPSQESGDKSLNCPSPESGNNDPASSQGSGNCGSAVSGSEGLNYPSPDSSNSANNSINEVVDQKVKVEELGNSSMLKRKKENGDSNSESRNSKYRRSNAASESANHSSGLNDEDEKKKARLIRNRESAQLSRQRKKHYVEELEDKVRAMHSTIQDLNAKISYIVAENASLRQQMGGNGAGAGPVCPQPVMYPHPGMAPMPYPWMPCPPYVVKPQGSQVPLVPIPRLKPQQPAAAPKTKKAEVKKGEGKTKKVASVSFLGLLFFIMVFGGLVPMVNVKYGGLRDAYSGGSNHIDSRLYDQHHGRVLTVNGHVNVTNHNTGIGILNEKFGAGIPCGRGHAQNERGLHPLPGSDEFKRNDSEPLVASLYVPRNHKLVKIDGNLIIHSVLASEKAMASRQETEMTTNEETGLAVALDLAPALPVPGAGRNNRRHPRQRALASDEDYLKSKAADGKLQQWFREGLAGPLLSSGMCTEVFRFDVSAASGAIIPATSVRNMTAEHRQNSTYVNNKGRNRRILHGLPIPLPGSSIDNITKEHVGSNSDKGNSHKNSSLSSSMVVSVLVDPREAGDGDGDGEKVMGKKSFPRIFVVVLLDSVKYVTYSCVLPLMGSSHVVTT